VTVQATWTTPIETFEEFCRVALRDPDLVNMVGDRPCFPRELTLTSIIEERTGFFVKGPDWRARAVRKSAGELALDYAEARAHKSSRKRSSRIRKIRFVRER
jgi:hypothetical protein